MSPPILWQLFVLQDPKFSTFSSFSFYYPVAAGDVFLPFAFVLPQRPRNWKIAPENYSGPSQPSACH